MSHALIPRADPDPPDIHAVPAGPAGPGEASPDAVRSQPGPTLSAVRSGPVGEVAAGPPPEAARRPLAPPTVLSLHGSDQETGRPVTWHVTPLADEGAPGTYLVERVDGDIHSPALWMQAQRAAATVGEDDVIDLVRRVVFGTPA